MSQRFAPIALTLSGVAARQLGWHPDAFWRATPAELVTALAPPAPAAPLTRATLQRLMEQNHE